MASVTAITPIPSCPAGQSYTDLGCVSEDPAGFFKQFYGYGLGIIGGVGIIFLLYGGYLILTSQGNPINIDSGKRYITYAIIGILFAVFGYLFVQIIAVDILHIPGFQ